jgi:hypothetical protein
MAMGSLFPIIPFRITEQKAVGSLLPIALFMFKSYLFPMTFEFIY